VSRPIPQDAPLEDYVIDFELWKRNAPLDADGLPTRPSLINLMHRIEAEMPVVADIAITSRLLRTLVTTKDGYRSRTFRDALAESQRRIA